MVLSIFYSLFYIFIKKGGIDMIQLSWTTIKEVQIIDELIKDNLLRDGDYFITVKNSGCSTYYDKLKFAEQLKELVTDKLNRYVLSKKRNEFRWAINLTDRKTISENSFVERYKVYFEYPDDITENLWIVILYLELDHELPKNHDISDQIWELIGFHKDFMEMLDDATDIKY